MISFESWRPAPERRNYTDAALGFYYSEAVGRNAAAAMTGALQTASGILSRAFASAAPDGDLGVLTPQVLSDIGYDLVRQGESLHILRVDEDRPAASARRPRRWCGGAGLCRPAHVDLRADAAGAWYDDDRDGAGGGGRSRQDEHDPYPAVARPVAARGGEAHRAALRGARGRARQGSVRDGRAGGRGAGRRRRGHDQGSALAGVGPCTAGAAGVPGDDQQGVGRRRVERSAVGLGSAALRTRVSARGRGDLSGGRGCGPRLLRDSAGTGRPIGRGARAAGELADAAGGKPWQPLARAGPRRKSRACWNAPCGSGTIGSPRRTSRRGLAQFTC